MALNRWMPRQKKVSQINTLTPAAVDIGDTFTVTINTKAITFTATVATVANVTAGLVALLQASAEPEFARITWTDSTTLITATAKVAGTPFTQTSSSTGGTLTTATPTANKSPNDVNDALNWTDGIPTNGDDILIDLPGIENSMYWNLGALTAVTVASITRRLSAKGAKIGLPEVNRQGAAYSEYLATEFDIGMQTGFTVLIEVDPTDAAESIKLNTNTTQTTLTVRGSSAAGIGNEVVWWRGSHASNVVNVENSSLAIGPVNNNAATVATLNVQSATVRVGAGVTLGVINNNRGQLKSNAGFTTLTQLDGSIVVEGNALNITTATIQGGTFDYRAIGTITTMTLGSRGKAEFGNDNRARIITNTINAYKGASFNDPAATTIAGGLDITPVGCGINDIKVNVGPSRTFTVA